MNTACVFEEVVLLDYLLGEASPMQRAAIEQSPACQAEAARLARQLAALYRVDCPDAAALVAFQERRVADTLALVIDRHAASCPHCASELALLRAIDVVPLVAPPSPLRQIVRAVFQSPLNRAVPVRGDVLLYTTSDFAVHLRVRQAIGQPGMWTVRGQVRTADGHLADGHIQNVQARAANGNTVDASVDAGAFRFEQLSPGVWALALQIAEEEIVIEPFAIGESDLPPTL